MTADLIRRAAAKIREQVRANPAASMRSGRGLTTDLYWDAHLAELVADVLDNEAAFIEDQRIGDAFLASPLAALAYRVLGEA